MSKFRSLVRKASVNKKTLLSLESGQPSSLVEFLTSGLHLRPRKHHEGEEEPTELYQIVKVLNEQVAKCKILAVI